jgi:hypothetical protein
VSVLHHHPQEGQRNQAPLLSQQPVDPLSPSSSIGQGPLGTGATAAVGRALLATAALVLLMAVVLLVVLGMEHRAPKVLPPLPVYLGAAP